MHDTTTTLHSEHLRAYGLRTDPFGESVADEFFFNTPQLSQRLNLLHHLVQYSDRVLLVTGTRGSGKTTLLNRLIASASEPWRASVVEADVEMDPDKLIRQAAEGLGLPARGTPSSDSLAGMQAHLEALRGKSQRAVLLIDEAHLLPAQSLAAALSLIKEHDLESLHLLLFGEPHVVEQVAAAGGPGHDVTHVVDIPLLTEEQVGDYIHLRLSHAGLMGDSPFTPEAAATICRNAGGLPGLVNTAARQFLINHAGAARRLPMPAPLRALSARPLVLAGGVLLAAAVFSLVWLAASGGGARPAQRAIAIPGLESSGPRAPVRESYQPVPGTTPAPAQVRVKPLDRPQTEPPVAMPEPGEAHPEQSPPPAAAAAPAPAVPRSPEPAPVSSASPPAPAPKPAPEPKPLPRATPTAATPPRPASPVPQTSHSGPKGEAWLLAQPSSRYTVQLTGTREHQAALDFIRTHRLGAEAAVFRTLLSGKDWYVVVLGSYPSRDAAIAAIARLPPALRRHGPWARALQSVHEGIGLARRSR